MANINVKNAKRKKSKVARKTSFYRSPHRNLYGLETKLKKGLALAVFFFSTTICSTVLAV